MPEKKLFWNKKGTQPIPQSSTQHLTNHMLFFEELKGQVHAYNKVCCTLPSNYWNSWTTLLQSTSNGTALFFMVKIWEVRWEESSSSQIWKENSTHISNAFLEGGIGHLMPTFHRDCNGYEIIPFRLRTVYGVGCTNSSQCVQIPLPAISILSVWLHAVEFTTLTWMRPDNSVDRSQEGTDLYGAVMILVELRRNYHMPVLPTRK